MKSITQPIEKHAYVHAGTYAAFWLIRQQFEKVDTDIVFVDMYSRRYTRVYVRTQGFHFSAHLCRTHGTQKTGVIHQHLRLIRMVRACTHHIKMRATQIRLITQRYSQQYTRRYVRSVFTSLHIYAARTVRRKLALFTNIFGRSFCQSGVNRFLRSLYSSGIDKFRHNTRACVYCLPNNR